MQIDSKTKHYNQDTQYKTRKIPDFVQVGHYTLTLQYEK